tara:strand:- start:141 stop:464 length:324 start_codon:yes stop_codon:yes gene_type:complete
MKKLSETYKELGIAFVFPIEIRDTKGRSTYYESSRGFWNKREYDSNGNQTYFESDEGYWRKQEYDSNGNQTYYENSKGHKTGTPRSKSRDGQVLEIDGIKYELKLKN